MILKPGSSLCRSAYNGASGYPPSSLVDSQLVENAGAPAVAPNDTDKLSAQQFNANGKSITSVKLKNYWANAPDNPTGTHTITIEADNAGEPSGTALATMTFSVSTLPTGVPASFQEYVFDTPTSPLTGTPWMVLNANYTTSPGSQSIHVRYQNTDIDPTLLWKTSTDGRVSWAPFSIEFTYEVWGF